MISGTEPWIGNAITGATALFAAYMGLFGSTLQARFQMKMESRRRNHELIEKKFDVYNKVIKANGTYDVTTVYMDSQYLEQMNVRLYREQIRPFLFDALHILDADVRDKARELDNKLSAIDFLDKIGHLPEEEADEALGLYSELIQLIGRHYIR